MGWIWLAVIGVAAFGALVLLRVDRTLWSMVASALMLGAAGYALQGSPNLAAHPVVADSAPAPDDSDMIALRDALFGTHARDYPYIVAGDAMTRIGEQGAAIKVLLGGIQKEPTSGLLWTALGTATVAHDANQVSPPALFDFQQAMRVVPTHPGPPFFLGLAYIRAGDFAAARPYWARALALTPPNLSYRKDIEVRLALLDRFLAASQAPPGR